MDSATFVLPQDNLPLEQQVARLQALLEATRQVHSTIKADEVLTRTARILVRELEMEGALFLSPTAAEPMVSWGSVPPAPYQSCERFPLISREEHLLAELIVAPPTDSSLSLYERDFIEGLVLQTAVALENATLTNATWSGRACSRIWTQHGRFSDLFSLQACQRFPGFQSVPARLLVTKSVATTLISSDWQMGRI